MGKRKRKHKPESRRSGAKRKVLESGVISQNEQITLTAGRDVDADTEQTHSLDFQPTWVRPMTVNGGPQSSKSNISFQMMDIDHNVSFNCPLAAVEGLAQGHESILRIYGVTDSGMSVCCHVHGFLPYFYVSVPTSFAFSNCEDLKTLLNEALLKDMQRGADAGCVDMLKPTQKEDNTVEPVLKIELVCKRSALVPTGDEKIPFAKITMNNPSVIPMATQLLEGCCVSVPGVGSRNYKAFESTLDFESRFMIDHDIVGCSWIELPAAKYSVRDQLIATTHCQLEVDVAHEEIISHLPGGEWVKLAPLRILCFDISCSGNIKEPPDPKTDSVVQIMNLVVLEGDCEPFLKTVFTLNTFPTTTGVQILKYAGEKQMLEGWAAFVRKTDPDVLTGYDINSFHLPFLLNRAKRLNAKNFSLLGRARDIKASVIQTKFMGPLKNKVIGVGGRIIFDLFPVNVTTHKLESHSFNSVCSKILGEENGNISDSLLLDQQTEPQPATSCFHNVFRSLRLLYRSMCLTNHVEMARITGMPIRYLLTKSKQSQVMLQLQRKATQQDFILPLRKNVCAKEQKIAPAIPRKQGYYDAPVATFRFHSFYPNIVIANNLCYTTLQYPPPPHENHADKYIITPSNDYFIQPTIRKGILPTILEELSALLKSTEEELINIKDPRLKTLLNARQVALNANINLICGFVITSAGILFCPEIWQSVTSFATELMKKAKDEIEKHYQLGHGRGRDLQVICESADYIMVTLDAQSVQELTLLGSQMAAIVSQTLPAQIEIELNKIHHPLLFLDQNKYASISFTKPDFHGTMDCNSLGLLQDDVCPLVATAINKCLEFIILKRKPLEAVTYAKKIVSNLLSNNIEISELVFTKTLLKKPKKYNANHAHVNVAERMERRDPDLSPKVGDQVRYVITASCKAAPFYRKAEDPDFVLEHNIPIDANYYLNNHLSGPLLKIFFPIYGDTTSAMIFDNDFKKPRPLHRVGKILTEAASGNIKATIRDGADMDSSSSDNDASDEDEDDHKNDVAYYQRFLKLDLLEDKLIVDTWRKDAQKSNSGSLTLRLIDRKHYLNTATKADIPNTELARIMKRKSPFRKWTDKTTDQQPCQVIDKRNIVKLNGLVNQENRNKNLRPLFDSIHLTAPLFDTDSPKEYLSICLKEVSCGYLTKLTIDLEVYAVDNEIPSIAEYTLQQVRHLKISLFSYRCSPSTGKSPNSLSNCWNLVERLTKAAFAVRDLVINWLVPYSLATISSIPEYLNISSSPSNLSISSCGGIVQICKLFLSSLSRNSVRSLSVTLSHPDNPDSLLYAEQLINAHSHTIEFLNLVLQFEAVRARAVPRNLNIPTMDQLTVVQITNDVVDVTINEMNVLRELHLRMPNRRNNVWCENLLETIYSDDNWEVINRQLFPELKKVLTYD